MPKGTYMVRTESLPADTAIPQIERWRNTYVSEMVLVSLGISALVMASDQLPVIMTLLVTVAVVITVSYPRALALI